ncbi:MAG: hypothetical protein QXH21_08175 [Ignisphaera sp.]
MPQKERIPKPDVMIRIKDLDELKKVLEDVELMEPVYSRFLSKPIVKARLGMYNHEDGAVIDGKGKRMWIYVTVVNAYSESYDIALWKILKYAAMYPSIRSKLEKYIEVDLSG